MVGSREFRPGVLLVLEEERLEGVTRGHFEYEIEAVVGRLARALDILSREELEVPPRVTKLVT